MFRQPDARSCGASVLVTAAQLAGSVRVADRAAFEVLVLTAHRRLTAVATRGRLQLPWPRALGTPPWTLARELGALHGVRYRIRWVRTGAVVDQVAGHDLPVAVYIGSRWLPRHVVLALPDTYPADDRTDDQTGPPHDPTDPATPVYDPAVGALVTLARARWQGPLRLAGWDQPWFALVPGAQAPSPASSA